MLQSTKNTTLTNPSHHSTAPHIIRFSNYAKSITYGGLDGIVTTFAVVAGATGGELGTTTIIILGFSNLLADGFSMAMGDYLSSTVDKNSTQALPNALATFLSFNLFGLIPLLAYLGLEQWIALSQTQTLLLASLIVSCSLLLLGWVKATITRQGRQREMLRTLAVGLLAALVAYGIGQFLGHII